MGRKYGVTHLKLYKGTAQSNAVRASKLDVEIMVQQHREWVKSSGRIGQRADFSQFNLEGANLTGTNPRNALLNKTVLKGADLLVSDLQGASLAEGKRRRESPGSETMPRQSSGRKSEGSHRIAGSGAGCSQYVLVVTMANTRKQTSCVRIKRIVGGRKHGCSRS